jgi:phage shock protein PspC (stress-responsive transcriptional regulator)
MSEDSAGPDRAEPGKEGYAHRGADRLPRTREGRVVTGVCAGLGRYTGIDPLIFRVGFALLVMANGIGIPLYVGAALLMPDEQPDSSAAAPSVAEQLLRRRFDGDTTLTILGGLLSLGVLLNFTGGGSQGPLTVIPVCALVLLVAHSRGVNFAELARTLPERLQGRPLDTPVPPPAPAPATAAAPVRPVSFDKGTGDKNTGLPPGMIDLATLGTGSMGRTVPPPAPFATHVRPSASVSSCGSSVLTSVTLLVAMMAVAAMIPATVGHPPNNAVQIGTATGLAVVGLGLVIGSMYGRGRGLVACGTVLSLGLVTTSVIAEAPVNGRFGDVEWRPIDATRSEQFYKIAVGSGRLDLTALPLDPGQRIKVNAEITLGELQVKVPRTARIDLHVRAGLGDATVERRVTSGPNAKVNELLEPESRPKNPPVIELHVRGRIGNVEVSLA